MNINILTKSYLLAAEHQLFNHCHASSLVLLPDGELLCAFFAGQREGEEDVAIWLSRTCNAVWQAPIRLMAQNGLAHWNPVLHAQGDTVWLFFKVGPTVHEWVTRWSVSHDRGLTWSASSDLVPGDSLPRGPVKNKLITMSNGEWLAPGSIENEQYWDAFVDISPDQGATWQKFDVPIEHLTPVQKNTETIWQGLSSNALWESNVDRIFRWDGVIQPSLWESTPGSVHMLMRSTRGCIYRSDSSDFGRTWSQAYATPLPNNNSGIDVVRLSDSSLLLAYNPISGNWGKRYPISLSCSMDNGVHWSAPFDLEHQTGEFSYPAIICDGHVIHLTYTSNRKNIVYQKIVLEEC